MEKYSKANNLLINKGTNTIVKTTGVHGDKTMRYCFEAYRLLDDGTWTEETELFQKQPFAYLSEEERASLGLIE